MIPAVLWAAVVCSTLPVLAGLVGRREDMGFKAVKLAIHSDSDEQLQVVARGVAVQNLDNVVGVHIFSFGDIFRSAKWLESYVNRLR